MEEKTELPTAGCDALSKDELDHVVDVFFKDILDLDETEKFFTHGFLAGLAFHACPEDKETYGLPVTEFCKNGYRGLTVSILSKTTECIVAINELLEALRGADHE